MPMVELRGLSALEAWSRKVTQGYKDVKVHDLSTSWRDGLAFCALIHHFRPDLIDFDSLSKENILYNNRLAFQIAEKHLSVPSLLDAEDMFKCEEPDRLSVATYLSQFYECFEGPKSDRKHSITESSPESTSPSTPTSKTVDNITNTTDSSDTTGANSRPIPPKRDMKCQKCKTRVYILERMIVNDNCYHKSCYESLTTNPELCPQTVDNNNEINLNDINLEESCDQIIADKCIDTQITDQRIGVNTGRSSDNSVDPIDRSDTYQSISIRGSDRTSMERPAKPQIPAKTFLKPLKSVDNSSDNCPPKPDISSPKPEFTPEDNEESKKSLEECSSKPEISLSKVEVSLEDNNKSKKSSNECLNVTENNEETVDYTDGSVVDDMFNKVFGESVKISDISTKDDVEETDPQTTEDNDVIYPDDKNPFGDEEVDLVIPKVDTKKLVISSESPKVSPNKYPDDKNPFDDEDSEETAEDVSKLSTNKKSDLKLQSRRRSSDALNPFGDEDIDDNEDNSTYSTPKPKPRQSLNVSTPNSAVPSPTSSLRSRKKRPAPTPPSTSTPSIPQVNSSCSLSSSFVAASGDSSRRDSLISSVSSDLGSSVPNSRTPTPLPRLKLQKSTEELSHLADNQPNSDKNSDQNSSLRSIDSDPELKSRSSSDLRVKKRPAPPIPAVKRIIKGSLAEIEEELNKIGDLLPGIEKRSKELEEILMKRLEDKSEEQAVKDNSEGQLKDKSEDKAIKEKSESQTFNDEKDLVMDEFMSTAREKCRLARRQKELMYMKREHKLEEIQADIEYQMRCVISKQAAQKTEEDLKREEELLQRLVEIIEERNVIIENMVDDENKEVEEFQRIVSKVMPTKPSISASKVDSKKENKLLAKQKTIDRNLIKFKDKLKLKDIKEKKKLKKLEKSEKTPEKSDKIPEKLDKSSEKCSEKSSEKSKSKDSSVKHLTLRGTLKPLKKSLGLKSSSDKKASVVVSEQTANGSNASISDKN